MKWKTDRSKDDRTASSSGFGKTSDVDEEWLSSWESTAVWIGSDKVRMRLCRLPCGKPMAFRKLITKWGYASEAQPRHKL